MITKTDLDIIKAMIIDIAMTDGKEKENLVETALIYINALKEEEFEDDEF